MLLFLIWCGVLVTALVLYFRQVYSFFSKRGVKTSEFTPPVGSMGRIILRKEHISESFDRDYFGFPGERFVGKYEMLKPLIFVRDLELIKKITIKDFEYFIDHRSIVSEKNDPLFGRNLFSMKGQEWKDMRSNLSPAFTSSKIRLMVPFMLDVGDLMLKNIKQKIKENDASYLDVDVRDLTTRFATDVIGSCAFGLKVDSQADRDNQFYNEGLNVTGFRFRRILLLFLFGSFPRLTEKLNIPLFSETTQRFFRSLVLDTMKDREARHVIRPDMIHLLMELKKGKLTHDDKAAKDADAGFATVEESEVGKKDIHRDWSDTDLVAQALLFFIAGFETVSTVMTFLLYELAVNPDAQDKLVEEIRETSARNGGKFDYNSIQQMTYMDMVVSEVLRKWPPAVGLDRICVKDYNLGKPNAEATEEYIVRKGDCLQIPTWSIHHDPEYFPNPHQFDPERFSEQNKLSIRPFTYMPFGLGPRNCIGSRFALCEVKVMVYQLLQQIEVSPGPKTPIPVVLQKDNFNFRMEAGHWLRFKVRN